MYFADDVKLYAKSTDYLELQNLLNRITEWSNLRQLPLSFSKTQILHFGRSNPKITYKINDIDISYEPNSTIRDLGVLLTENFNFSQHIGKIVQNSFHRMSLIFKYSKS